MVCETADGSQAHGMLFRGPSKGLAPILGPPRAAGGTLVRSSRQKVVYAARYTWHLYAILPRLLRATADKALRKNAVMRWCDTTTMKDLTPPTQSRKAADHLANERTFLAWIRTSNQHYGVRLRGGEVWNHLARIPANAGQCRTSERDVVGDRGRLHSYGHLHGAGVVGQVPHNHEPAERKIAHANPSARPATRGHRSVLRSAGSWL